MINFVRTFCITIASGLFAFVPTLYKLFYDLAGNHNLFSSETLQTFSRNIYVLISVVMLFAFAVKAIESIINPDLLFDSKKGFTAVIKRSAIALVLIILVPYGFTMFYQVQDEVMSKSLIEKIILGVNVDNSQNTSDNQNTENNKNNIADSTGAAQMLASVALQSVLHPEGETCTEYEDANVCSEYLAVINDDVGKIFHLVDNINEKVENSEGEQDYVLEYEWNGLLSLIVGGALIYFLSIFCLDTALRLIKMAFLELTAPISIIAYIYAGNDTLKKWWKEVLATAMSLFGRIAALAFMIFVLSKLPEFTANNFGGKIYTNIVNLLIIFATLMFIKEAPSMIDKLFGIKVGGKGGIAGRLGSMAGVGDIAKSAWEKMRNVGVAAVGAGALALGGATALALNPLAGGALIGAGLGGKAIANKLRGTKVGEALSTAGNAIAAMSKEKNPISAVKAAQKSVTDSPYGVVKTQTKASKTREKINESIEGMDKDGTVTDSNAANTNYKDAVNNSNFVPFAMKKELNDRHDAGERNGIVNGVKDRSDKITEQIDNAKKFSNNETKMILDQLNYDRTHDVISESEFLKQVDNLRNQSKSGVSGIGVNDAIFDEINKNLNQMHNLAVSAGIESAIFSPDGKLQNVELSKVVASAKAAYDLADSNYKAALGKVTDERQKSAIEAYASNSDAIIEKSVKDIAKGTTIGTNPAGGTSSTNSTTATTSTTSGSSTTTTSGTTSSNQNTQSSNTSYNQEEDPTGLNLMADAQREDRESRSTRTTSTNSSVDTSAYDEYVNYNDSVTRNNSTSGSSTMNNTGQSSTGYEIPTDGGGYSDTTNNSNTQSGTNTTIVNNTTNNTTSNEQALSSFFSSLSNDIKNANRETNNILSDQLKSQQSMLDESKKQSRSLDNISGGVDSIKGSVDELGNKMDSYGTSINRNIDNLNKKIDDSDNE